MHINTLCEGLFEQELKGLVQNIIDVNSFAPKAQNNAMVVAVKVSILDAAQELSNYIDKSAIENIIDVEVSPAPDVDGKYWVFMEFNDDINAENIKSLIYVINNVCFVDNWEIKLYGVKTPIKYDKDVLERYLRLSTKITKRKLELQAARNARLEFLRRRRIAAKAAKTKAENKLKQSSDTNLLKSTS